MLFGQKSTSRWLVDFFSTCGIGTAASQLLYLWWSSDWQTSPPPVAEEQLEVCFSTCGGLVSGRLVSTFGTGTAGSLLPYLWRSSGWHTSSLPVVEEWLAVCFTTCGGVVAGRLLLHFWHRNSWRSAFLPVAECCLADCFSPVAARSLAVCSSSCNGENI